MRDIKHIAFVIDRFELGSPAQQLLDRFLIGYQRDGAFIPNGGRKISVSDSIGGELIQKRVADFGLKFHDKTSAVDAIVIVHPTALLETLKAAGPLIPIFAYGPIPSNAPGLERLLGATVLATALRLPEIKVSGRVRDALIVVQGSNLEAELMALDGILPFVEGKTARVRYLEGAEVWEAGRRNEWPWPLLRAALSRSDTPQGNTLVDGRSDDFGKLAPDIAKAPRGWILEHAKGARTTLLVLDGVIDDTVLALKADGKIVSTQLFRAPSPAREDYSRLAAVIDDFFVTGKSPLKIERPLEEARLLDHFARPQSKNGQWHAVG